MSTQTTTDRGGRRSSGSGAPRRRPKSGKEIPPIVSGQVTTEERAELVRMSVERDRSMSFIVGLAVRRFIADDKSGQIDWSAPA